MAIDLLSCLKFTFIKLPKKTFRMATTIKKENFFKLNQLPQCTLECVIKYICQNLLLLHLQGVSKKTPLKEMCDFLTLKMLPLALALIKTKIAIFLTHWSENAHFTWEFRVFDVWREFSIEKGQFLTNGSKMAIFCFDQRQSQW